MTPQQRETAIMLADELGRIGEHGAGSQITTTGEVWHPANTMLPAAALLRKLAFEDPTDPGHDVDVLREQVRHLERRVRELAQKPQELENCEDFGTLMAEWEADPTKAVVLADARTQLAKPLDLAALAQVFDSAPDCVEVSGKRSRNRRCEMTDSDLLSLARRCLWIAYVWNDHNFQRRPDQYAREQAQDLGINTLEEANEWIEKINATLEQK